MKKQENLIMKRDKTKKEKWLFALSILLHITAVALIFISFFVPILKPVFNVLLESFAKLLVFGLMLFFWFAVGVISIGLLFTVPGYQNIPSLVFKELFHTETEFVVIFDYDLMVICGIVSLIVCIISLVLLAKQKDTFKPKNYKNKKGRRIFHIIISLLVIVLAALFKFEIF